MEKEVLEHDCFFGGSARGGGCGSADNSDLFLRLNGKSDQELANHKCDKVSTRALYLAKRRERQLYLPRFGGSSLPRTPCVKFN